MINKRKAQIIADCLNKVEEGVLTKQECLKLNPMLAEEIEFALSTREAIHSIPMVETPDLLRRMKKYELIRKISPRQETVTNLKDDRYKLQNLKWRFVMTWVIIVATIFSVISGTGAVLASGDALPGDFLYPVKTWTEDVQVAFTSNEGEPALHMRFMDTRVEELFDLIEEEQFDDLEIVVGGYENQTKLLLQLISQVEAKDTEEAIQLRTQLMEKLQEQERIMQMVCDGEGEELKIREQVQVMLEINNQLQLHVNKKDVQPEAASEDPEIEEMVPASGDGSGKESPEKQPQNGKKDSSLEMNVGEGVLTFGLGGKGADGVYVSIEDTRFDCVVNNDTATCNINGAPQKGVVDLRDSKTGQLLFRYSYEYQYSHGESLQGGHGENESDDQHQGGGSDGKGKDPGMD